MEEVTPLTVTPLVLPDDMYAAIKYMVSRLVEWQDGKRKLVVTAVPDASGKMTYTATWELIPVVPK